MTSLAPQAFQRLSNLTSNDAFLAFKTRDGTLIWNVAILLFACYSLQCPANVISANSINYIEVLAHIMPGDTMLLQPGNYQRGLPIHRLQGEASQPITITGPENGPHPVFVARQGHNTISINNASYIVTRNLELDGQGMPAECRTIE